MSQLESILLPSAAEIHERLDSPILKNLEPEIRSQETLMAEFTPLTEQEIIDDVFDGYEERARETLLESLARRPEIKLYKNENGLYGVEVPSWDGIADFSMVILVIPKALLDQQHFFAQDIYIINTKNKQSVSYGSLLPLDTNLEHRQIDFNYLWDNPITDQTRKELIDSNGRTFAVGGLLSVGEVHTLQTFGSLLHEAGHLWENFLKIFTTTDRQLNARKGKFSFSKDALKNGHEASLKVAQEIGFSERMANIIGKLLERKLKQNGFYKENQETIDWIQHSNVNGSTYDSRHAEFHLPLFDQIKTSFVSSANRRKNSGKEQMVEMEIWIQKQIDTLLDWARTLPSSLLVEDKKIVRMWQKKIGDDSFFCTVQMNDQNELESLRISIEMDQQKFYISFVPFAGIVFKDFSVKPAKIMALQVGIQDPQQTQKREIFEKIREELLKFEIPN